MIKILAAGLLSINLILVAGCSVTPQEYQNESPTFDMKTYFSGDLQALGLFQDYRGKVVKRFHITMNGSWKENQGVLDEFFTYSDGTKQRRTWNLTRVDKHTFTGTAADVIGEAKGQAYGNALRWQYVLALEVDDSVYHVNFDDWMWLIDEHTVINHSVMSKYGVTLGNVILVFRKNPQNMTPDIQKPEAETNGNFKMPEIHNIVLRNSAII